MSLQSRLTLLTQAIGADIKALLSTRGSLTALTTTAKTSLVAALNELHASIQELVTSGAGIDDDAGSDVTTATWSASKISAEIAAAISALVDDAPTALDTLKELADALGDSEDAISGLVTAVGNRVRFDSAQTLTTSQQNTACSNIGVGNPETDFVAVYTTAKS